MSALTEKIANAATAVELIGYREDAMRLPTRTREAALRLIQDKFETLRRQTRPRAPVRAKTKSIQNLFGKHTQISDATDPDYGNPPSPCAVEPPTRRRKSK